MQVFSNPIPITQRSIIPQQNRNKPPFTQSSTNTPQALTCATSFAVGLSGSSQTSGGKKMKSCTHLPLLISLINTRIINTGWRDAPFTLQDFSRGDKQKMRFQLPLNMTFCPTPSPLTHQQLKQPHKAKINKIMVSAPFPSSLVFHTKFIISKLKSK